MRDASTIDARLGHRPRATHAGEPLRLDWSLLLLVLALLGWGLVMVASASMPIGERNLGDPNHFLHRHLFALTLALGLGAVCLRIPLQFWSGRALVLILAGIGTLLLVLIPGVGHTVNGATRWIPLPLVSLQPSEFFKLWTLIFISDYLVRRRLEVQAYATGFIWPMLPIVLAFGLILMQPDLGTAIVIFVSALGLLWLGGMPLLSFFVLAVLAALGFVLLVIFEPYRMQRVVSFLDPFADPYNSGYQLTQALIAFGRGEWLGVGLGAGIQKQLYLPEAHTDFLLAVIGEEFGLVGVLVLVGLFAALVWRAFAIGARARALGENFAAYLAHGIGLLIGLQALINVGVNTGLFPTKGLPLPFMSYGSNALIVSVVAVALLLRIDLELRRESANGAERPRRRAWRRV